MFDRELYMNAQLYKHRIFNQTISSNIINDNNTSDLEYH